MQGSGWMNIQCITGYGRGDYLLLGDIEDRIPSSIAIKTLTNTGTVLPESKELSNDSQQVALAHLELTLRRYRMQSQRL
eukprot:2768453-Karenia_brevis.AAC.1